MSVCMSLSIWNGFDKILLSQFAGSRSDSSGVDPPPLEPFVPDAFAQEDLFLKKYAGGGEASADDLAGTIM